MVLIVGTDRVLVDLIELSLRRNGYIVKATENPLEITPLIEEIQPQVILLDLFIPGWNTLEILEEIKHKTNPDYCRVLVITNLGFMEVLQQAVLLGAGDFLIKPFDIDVLIKKINQLLMR